MVYPATGINLNETIKNYFERNHWQHGLYCQWSMKSKEILVHQIVCQSFKGSKSLPPYTGYAPFLVSAMLWSTFSCWAWRYLKKSVAT